MALRCLIAPPLQWASWGVCCISHNTLTNDTTKNCYKNQSINLHFFCLHSCDFPILHFCTLIQKPNLQSFKKTGTPDSYELTSSHMYYHYQCFLFSSQQRCLCQYRLQQSLYKGQQQQQQQLCEKPTC